MRWPLRPLLCPLTSRSGLTGEYARYYSLLNERFKTRRLSFDEFGREAFDLEGVSEADHSQPPVLTTGFPEDLLSVFTPEVQEQLKEIAETECVEEIVVDLGEGVYCRVDKPEDNIIPLEHPQVTREILDEYLARLDEQSMSGTFRWTSDNRGGFPGSLHRISRILDLDESVCGLTVRVGRSVGGAGNMLMDVVRKLVEAFVRNREPPSVLLVGPPGKGKTTLLRDLARLISGRYLRTIVIDTSGEIAGSGDVKHPGIGRARRMPVRTREGQYHVMLEAVQNHSAQVVIIDEIGTPEEVRTARTISQRGVSLVATAHGRSLKDLTRNPELRPLLGSVNQVILSAGERAALNRESKTKSERTGDPTFRIIVELLERRKWRIHWDAAYTMDRILENKKYEYEVRWESDGQFFSRTATAGKSRKDMNAEWRNVLGMLTAD